MQRSYTGTSYTRHDSPYSRSLLRSSSRGECRDWMITSSSSFLSHSSRELIRRPRNRCRSTSGCRKMPCICESQEAIRVDTVLAPTLFVFFVTFINAIGLLAS
ncbi:hypothetical protein PoB_007253300 [Plakobranchus ocellatus]|uniref:Uncharacterized protein n=1 Tax=Plakobranchus ocellatus TaxID=259542 RepID=A0AAV4DPP3_9GAST|nr:hypothetical protein PoB_007253300 [Plakobranchus ocellatus]